MNWLPYKGYEIKYWEEYYIGSLYRSLITQSWATIKNKKTELKLLFTYDLSLYLKLFVKKILHVV